MHYRNLCIMIFSFYNMSIKTAIFPMNIFCASSGKRAMFLAVVSYRKDR